MPGDYRRTIRSIVYWAICCLLVIVGGMSAITFGLRNYAPVITAKYYLEMREGQHIVRKWHSRDLPVQLVSDRIKPARLPHQ